MKIKVDDLRGGEIASLLQQHIDDMRATSPPESVHALDLESLRQSAITFWSIWESEQLAGCGAIKELDQYHAEIKSMRTSTSFQKRGVASTLLQHIIDEAKLRGYQRLSLETGSMEFFEPARKLYEKYGFDYCPPFSTYGEDPNSVFMTKHL